MNCTGTIPATGTRFIPWVLEEINRRRLVTCSEFPYLVRVFPLRLCRFGKIVERALVVSTVEHDVHKVKRASLNPHFSRRSVTQLEGVIKEKVTTMCDQIATFKGEVLQVRLAFSAAILDITTQYCM